MQDLITVWSTGLFYSKFMTVFWFTIPFLITVITYFVEKELENNY